MKLYKITGRGCTTLVVADCKESAVKLFTEEVRMYGFMHSCNMSIEDI